MITGHILAKVCVGFIWVAYLKGTSLLVLTLPLLLLTLFLGLELLIAYLQAYIFTFITCITIKDMAFFTSSQIAEFMLSFLVKSFRE
jgi:F-type H+-transporting ATPase subunit a